MAGGPSGPYVAITGERDLSPSEDLRILSLYAPLLIVAPTFAPDNFDDAYTLPFDFCPGRRARKRRRPPLRFPHADQFARGTVAPTATRESTRASSRPTCSARARAPAGFTAVTLRGDDLDVEGNLIFGGGSCVMLHGCTHARVAGNRLEVGPAGHGIYAFAHLTWPKVAPDRRQVNQGAVIEGNYCRQILIEDNLVRGAAPTSRDGVYLIYGTERTPRRPPTASSTSSPPSTPRAWACTSGRPR